jgi:DNA-binding NtrC family response regulator
MEKHIYPSFPILLVDDEEQALLSSSVALNYAGINNIVTCQESREVEKLLSQTRFSVVILDMYMPVVTGWDLLQIMVRDYPETPVIVMTGADEVETAVGCMKCGAVDYLVKPVDDNLLSTSLKRVIELNEIRDENEQLKKHLLTKQLEMPDAFTGIVTKNNSMNSIFQYIEAISKTSLPVLVTGETGCGKELIARTIHDVSGRRGAFAPVNVAGLDDTLFSDTLFGHQKGAFTGANTDREGMIKKASAGTLFLDEIGDLAKESQIKLLRLLQEKEYYPLGSDIPIPTDTRIIFATNQDIKNISETGQFRKDLFYRLQSHHIHIPPLRERKEDLPLLVDHFLNKAAQSLGKKRPQIPKELYTLLTLYEFPGNIRELEGVISDAVVRHNSGILSLEHFNSLIEKNDQSKKKDNKEKKGKLPEKENQMALLDPLPTLKQAKQMLIEEALRRTNNNQSLAARVLGLSRQALNSFLQRLK